MRKSTNLIVRNITVTAIAAGLLTAGAAMAQQPASTAAPIPANVNSGSVQQANVSASTWQAKTVEVPSGTKVLLELRSAVNTKTAKPGDGVKVAKTFHRIEESTLRQEIEAAGFKLVSEGDFLKHPEDPRDAAVFRPAVPVDEFVLKYQNPL